jgi:hypothetical protein
VQSSSPVAHTVDSSAKQQHFREKHKPAFVVMVSVCVCSVLSLRGKLLWVKPVLCYQMQSQPSLKCTLWRHDRLWWFDTISLVTFIMFVYLSANRKNLGFGKSLHPYPQINQSLSPSWAPSASPASFLCIIIFLYSFSRETTSSQLKYTQENDCGFLPWK